VHSFAICFVAKLIYIKYRQDVLLVQQCLFLAEGKIQALATNLSSIREKGCPGMHWKSGIGTVFFYSTDAYPMQRCTNGSTINVCLVVSCGNVMRR
jgi:hypothetical protein